MMIHKTHALRRIATLMLIGAVFLPAKSPALTSVEREFNSYSRGMVKLACLLIDGGIVPMNAPIGTQIVRFEDGLSVKWTDGKAVATFGAASPEESALIDGMNQPDALAVWTKYAIGLLDKEATEKTVRDFQPDILDVNHWHMGAISTDCLMGGLRSTNLLLLWRCRDGSTLAVKMSAATEVFENARKQLYQLIGSSLLIEAPKADASPAPSASH